LDLIPLLGIFICIHSQAGSLLDPPKQCAATMMAMIREIASKLRGQVHDRGRPEAIAVMKELGIDISGHRSKQVQEFENQPFDYVLTVCDNAKESCPVFPGHLNRIHKGFEDPAALQGTEKERLVLFRQVRDEIREYLKVFPS
jgi:arsenate reductase